MTAIAVSAALALVLAATWLGRADAPAAELPPPVLASAGRCHEPHGVIRHRDHGGRPASADCWPGTVALGLLSNNERAITPSWPADEDMLSPGGAAFLAALHADPPAEPPQRVQVPVPGSEEWWRHTFAAARLRDRLAVARLGAGLPADFRDLVSARGPIVAAEQQLIEEEFRAAVQRELALAAGGQLVAAGAR